MIKKNNIITGLGIGSSKVSAIALELHDGRSPEIIAYDSQPSRGIFRGAIIDLGEASNSVSKVLSALGEKSGMRPDNIYANVTGESIRGEKSRGMIPLSSRGREITKSDVGRCINAASTIRLAFDREIIHRIVLDFSIDDQPPIKNALGLYASRLLCEMYMITANLNHIQNIYKCVNNAGFDVSEVVYSGVADEMSYLEDAWKEEGVALVDMGSSLVENSIFYGGSLSSLDVIQIGSSDIKGDLRESAEFGEIVSRLKSKFDDFVKNGGNVKLVVLAGGLAFTEGVAEILEERLSRPVKMGVVKNVQGNISSIDSLKCATAIGLARYAAALKRPHPISPKGFINNVSDKIAEIFNNYF